VRTEMLETSFRIHRDEVTRTLIGCPPTAERQRYNGSAQRNGETATAERQREWWKPGISLVVLHL